MKELEDGDVCLDGTEGKFAAEVFAEGFRRDANKTSDFVLRDAAGGQETGQLSMAFGGAEGGAARVFW